VSAALTPPQERALRYLAAAEEYEYPEGSGRARRRPTHPREVALHLWPDSPAWGRRTRMYGGRNGAVGGTMPMKAASVLWRLFRHGLADKPDHGGNGWVITARGLRWVEENGDA